MILRRPLLAVMTSIVVVVAACSSGGASKAGSGSLSLSGDVVVLAAASLTGALTTIAQRFEDAHPGVHVRLTFDGSSRLAAEILQGVPADVFVAADEPTMTRVATGDHLADPAVIVATNELEIVVPQGNPLGIHGIEDLTRGPVVALCRTEVPCGAYADEAFHQAGLAVPAAGREDSVKAVLSKVQLGEADAGIVYRTDVLGAHGVRGIELPTVARVRAAYPAAVLRDAPNPSAATAFVTYLLARETQVVLASEGFGPP